MLPNGELTREDIAVDHDMQVDADIGQEILAYVETWFNVDEKFHIDTSDDDTWLNMYARYNPFADSLDITCEISSDSGSDYFDYEPTVAEADIIKGLVTQKINELYGQTPREFCEEFYGDCPSMDEMT